MPLLAALLWSTWVAAADVGVAGIMGNKAMLMIGGGEPEAIPVGQTYSGVRVVAIQGDQVVVEIDGRKRSLRVGQHAVGSGAGTGGSKVILTADGQGHFITDGTINGTSVRMMVDTGATMISIGAGDARRLGLDLSRGLRGVSATANGRVSVVRISLDKVQLGEITLHQVDAVVHPSEMPLVLLGMSFLNRLEMTRDGDAMTLKRRF